jgi:MFS family permease
LFFQLRYFDPSASTATIAAQAGLIEGSKTAAHVFTGLAWARLADSAYGGRKLVLVLSLLSSAVTILGYGLSTSFAAAIVWQILDGALNSTVSVVRCFTAEKYSEKR